MPESHMISYFLQLLTLNLESPILGAHLGLLTNRTVDLTTAMTCQINFPSGPIAAGTTNLSRSGARPPSSNSADTAPCYHYCGGDDSYSRP